MGKIEMASPSPLPCVKQKLERFVKEQPEDAVANYLYAMAVLKQQEHRADRLVLVQVESLLTKAVTLDPKCVDAYLQLGILSASQREEVKAIGYYKKAIEVDPQLGEAHYRLGVAYDRTGEPVKAKEEFLLHDEMEKQRAADIERQRRNIKQFLMVLQVKPGSAPAQ